MEAFAEMVVDIRIEVSAEAGASRGVSAVHFFDRRTARRADAVLPDVASFKQAVYSAENIGHFGLASDAYTHFTSPIRRYPDLVVHRILKAAIARRQASGPFHARNSKRSQASPANARRIAAQAERELFEWKKMILMEQHLGDTFDAIIIAVSKDGFTVELIDQFIEGFVPVADLPDGQYQLRSSGPRAHLRATGSDDSGWGIA